MANTNACPLNFKRVDESASRISALLVSSLVLFYLISANLYILLFLFVDFVLKLFLNIASSPVGMLSEFIKTSLHIKEKFVDGGAKRLAGFFGLFFVFLLIVTHIFHSLALSLGVALVFLSCSLLDAFFSYCIGCKIYFIIKKIFPSFMN
jgi:hypothetical protein